MSLISRLTTWVSGQILTATALNGEFNNVVNTINNLDGTSTAWTGVKTGTLQSTGVTIIKGSATNDAAATGNVGEYIESIVTSGSPVAMVSTVAKNVTTISLTAGDWDVTGAVGYVPGGTIAFCQQSISLVTNTNGAESNITTHAYAAAFTPTPLIEQFPTGVLRVSIASTTTVYLVSTVSFGTSMSTYGIIRARRMR